MLYISCDNESETKLILNHLQFSLVDRYQVYGYQGQARWEKMFYFNKLKIHEEQSNVEIIPQIYEFLAHKKRGQRGHFNQAPLQFCRNPTRPRSRIIPTTWCQVVGRVKKVGNYAQK